MSFLIDIADLPDPEHPGKTYRQANLAKPFQFAVGTLVEIISSGARMFIVHHGRDCDSTPLYYLSYDIQDQRQEQSGILNRSWVGGFPESALRPIGQTTAVSQQGWIGVDLDGTLAHYDGWQGPEHIGPPIPAMLERVQAWRQEGKRIKIFTARCAEPSQVPYVQTWLEQQGLGDCEITNVKDFKMIELWDDRCVEVETNTGIPVNRWQQ